MKKLCILFALLSNILFSQTWVQLNNIGNNITCSTTSLPPSRDAACLSLNGKIYLFTGKDNSTFTPTNTVWEYNPTNDSWCFKTNYPGNGLLGLTAFNIGNIAYLCGGYISSTNIYSDFYRYDPLTNNWKQLANIPVARSQASGFSIGAKGYICCGDGVSMGNGLNDLWEYDTTANNWTQKANFPDSARYLTTSFAGNGLGYVGLGYGSSHWFNKFYQYNPQTNSWANAPAFPGTGRCGAGSVILNSHAVILFGNKGMATFNDAYAFDFSTNTWNSFTTFTGPGRSIPLCGNLGNKLFMGGGSGSGGGMTYNDWWTIQTTLNINEKPKTERLLAIYQTEENVFTIKVLDDKILNSSYKVIDTHGKVICSGYLESGEINVLVNSKGLYIIQFGSEKLKSVKILLL